MLNILMVRAEWTSEIKNVPEEVFLVHGEPSAADAIRVKLQDRYHWHPKIPKLYEKISLVFSE